MFELILLGFLVLLLALVGFRQMTIDAYKIGYYETKLKSHGVDISHVENISYIEVMKG